ncbi:copper chaperone PCu(A)C [Actinoplanes sp. CA-142083]|uniref:copper chaperone PCu(A)C n=1 Tax=Actinoplanes sp. CA-142083 TaxID=3239903 RepID=UPI003D8B16FA
MRTLSRQTLVALAAAFAVGSLAACGADTSEATTAPPASSAPAATLTVKDPWVKAVDSDMTAAFGTLVNNTGKEITVVGASSPASPMELHEMAMDGGKMVMRPKEGGFVIPANGTHELSPGGDHLMLMKPSAPIKPGDQLQFTLILGDGATVAFNAVAKPFAGAGESYAPSAAPSMAGM